MSFEIFFPKCWTGQQMLDFCVRYRLQSAHAPGAHSMEVFLVPQIFLTAKGNPSPAPDHSGRSPSSFASTATGSSAKPQSSGPALAQPFQEIPRSDSQQQLTPYATTKANESGQA